MRTLRRHAAALLGVLLLQVLFLGTGAACAAGGATAAATAHDAHADHAAHDATPPDEGGDSAEGPDYTRGPLHCLATMSCATAGLVTAGATLDVAAAVQPLLVAAHADTAPASVGGAPEPPPPRG